MTSLAELGEISKGAPRYIKDIMAGKVVRQSPDIVNGGLNPVYSRLRRAEKGAAAAKAKAMGDESAFKYNKTMGGVYNHQPLPKYEPNLQTRLLKYKSDKQYAKWQQERAARTPPPPTTAPNNPNVSQPVVPEQKKQMTTKRKAAIGAGAGITGLAGLGAIGSTRQ